MLFFAKSKGDQEGDQLGPWHVHANPLQPHICPVLALALCAFSYPDVLSNGSKLFPGSNQYQRYVKEFYSVTKKYDEELTLLGASYKELGSHSTRKGVTI